MIYSRALLTDRLLKQFLEQLTIHTTFIFIYHLVFMFFCSFFPFLFMVTLYFNSHLDILLTVSNFATTCWLAVLVDCLMVHNIMTMRNFPSSGGLSGVAGPSLLALYKKNCVIFCFYWLLSYHLHLCNVHKLPMLNLVEDDKKSIRPAPQIPFFCKTSHLICLWALLTESSANQI